MPQETFCSYRMTEDEYRRYLVERDELASMPGIVDASVKLMRANPGKRIVDPTHGTTLYDHGENFYWVRTTRPVDWM